MMISDRLRQIIDSLFDSVPASLEMPAGTGKTHLLTACVAMAAESGKRSLVLTHTNAGVDAIRKRLKRFGVSSSSVVVETISSWAFMIVRSYPDLSGIVVPDIPDWNNTNDYQSGAIRANRSDALKKVHSVSFDFLFVDEYQDCSKSQHEFILGLKDAIPKSIVFGDRLQGIFGFADPLVDWEADVVPCFPSYPIELFPFRWHGHNWELGRWTLNVRDQLKPGKELDWSNIKVPGVIWGGSVSGITSYAREFRDFNETVLILDKWANDVSMHASRLGGSFSVMEDIQGRFMREKLQELENPSNTLSVWLLKLAKKCFVGLADLNSPVIRRLENGQSLDGLIRAGFENVMQCLNDLSLNEDESTLDNAIRSFEQSGVKLYRREAWRDTLEALRASIRNNSDATSELARIRDKVRKIGRRPEKRIASRTLLVKGLEFDHVIIANIQKFSDAENLYVALSRARKSVTIFGDSQITRIV